jgi:hypothetical protein
MVSSFHNAWVIAWLPFSFLLPGISRIGRAEIFEMDRSVYFDAGHKVDPFEAAAHAPARPFDRPLHAATPATHPDGATVCRFYKSMLAPIQTAPQMPYYR